MQKITEEMNIHKEWYEEARKITPESFPEFMRKLTKDYDHDYGTICHAIACAALAAANAVNRSECGGITGFQAGAVMWQFIGSWMRLENKPLKLLEYENMLYPQYENSFTKIRKGTWDYLQQEAKNRLETEKHAHENVVNHWKSIVDGVVPFGYQVEEDE